MIAIPASWMRGGTSKGVFFLKQDLPESAVERDRLLLQIIGSPDPYGKQINGIGGATSSTSKVVVIGKSDKPDCDVDYLFGHVAIRDPVIDYSGNCGNLTSAVGVFAIEHGLIDNVSAPVTPVRIWQENLGQHIVVNVPVDVAGKVINEGDVELAGISGTGAPITVDFIKPGRNDGTVLPTGTTRELLHIDDIGDVEVSLLHAGNATVFVHESALKLTGQEVYDELNNNSALLEKVEAIRCAASVKMGLTDSLDEARAQPGTPKLAYVAKPRDYMTTEGQQIQANDIDIYARIFSMGKLHHAFTGTGAIALAVAAAIPDTLVSDCLYNSPTNNQNLRVGHTAGVMDVSAFVKENNSVWVAEQASMVRTARTLMRGEVYVTA